MKFLKHLFGSIPMQAVAERTALEISARLAEVEGVLDSGQGDLVTALEERESLKRELQATTIREERRLADDARAKRQANREELDRRVDAIVTEINTHVARLIFATQDFDALVGDIFSGKLNAESRQIPELLSGLGHEFGLKLRRAIAELAPGVEWDFEAAQPRGTPGKPVCRTQVLAMPPAYVKDANGKVLGTIYY